MNVCGIDQHSGIDIGCIHPLTRQITRKETRRNGLKNTIESREKRREKELLLLGWLDWWSLSLVHLLDWRVRNIRRREIWRTIEVDLVALTYNETCRTIVLIPLVRWQWQWECFHLLWSKIPNIDSIDRRRKKRWDICNSHISFWIVDWLLRKDFPDRDKRSNERKDCHRCQYHLPWIRKWNDKSHRSSHDILRQNKFSLKRRKKEQRWTEERRERRFVRKRVMNSLCSSMVRQSSSKFIWLVARDVVSPQAPRRRRRRRSSWTVLSAERDFFSFAEHCEFDWTIDNIGNTIETWERERDESEREGRGEEEKETCLWRSVEIVDLELWIENIRLNLDWREVQLNLSSSLHFPILVDRNFFQFLHSPWRKNESQGHFSYE